jgi:cytochrome c-type biogenesis protein CcmH
VKAVARRDFFAVAAGVLLGSVPLIAQTPDSLPGSGPSGRLWDPARAGRPLEPVTAADNDAAIQAIEKRLHCTCGCGLDVYTCRTTDFTCTTSPEMHHRVVTLAQQGKSAQEILDAFVREGGLAILMAPPKRGFNLAGYFMPGLVIIVAGVLLTLALRRWTRAAAVAAPAAPAPPADASAAELERLRHELSQFTD